MREARAALAVLTASQPSGLAPTLEVDREVVVLRRLLEEMPETLDPRGWLDARLHELEHR